MPIWIRSPRHRAPIRWAPASVLPWAAWPPALRPARWWAPVGTIVGAAVGAVVGGLAGKGVAEAIDPTAEQVYWKDNYAQRPYVEQGTTYDDYGPAYAYGVDAFSRYPDREFEDFESELHRDWGGQRRGSSLEWDRARPAARDAWQRVKENSGMPPSTR